MGAIYRNGYKYGDGIGVTQNPVLAIKSGNELYKPENGIVELPDEAITVSATGSDMNISTSEGRLNTLTVYGKSEVVDGSIKSAGEGWSVVRLADLTWARFTGDTNFFYAVISNATTTGFPARGICNKYSTEISVSVTDKCFTFNGNQIRIRDDDYTTISDFVASLGDAALAYPLADPTQGNTIAIKTDNGTGIDGTMAVFETGTPLRGIPETDVRDVMEWDGSTGTVTKNCGKGDLGSFDYVRREYSGVYYFRSPNIISTVKPVADAQIANIYMASYEAVSANYLIRTAPNHTVAIDIQGYLYVRTDEIDNTTDFKTAMNGVKLIYELATPTTQNLTTAENASIAGLRTFTPTTHAQNNAGAVMTVEAYAGTENGKAVAAVASTLDSIVEAVPKKINISGVKTRLDKTLGELRSIEFLDSGGNRYDFNGHNVWTDGENIYYSSSLAQLVLDKATSTWSDKTWTGFTGIKGEYIWTDGENIYYSNSTDQYVLDKTTSTWSAKTWSGFTEFNGRNFWTDGDNIYYSSGTDHYVLNKATSTWSTKTWSGLSNFSGASIWTDGENIYFSATSNHYVLDKATSTWLTKTWSGLTSFTGLYTWTDGENIYYSSLSNQYVLDKATSTWLKKTWSGQINLDGRYIWTDGDNIYYCQGETSVKILPKSNKIGAARPK